MRKRLENRGESAMRGKEDRCAGISFCAHNVDTRVRFLPREIQAYPEATTKEFRRRE
jgi:hypothetical protein